MTSLCTSLQSPGFGSVDEDEKYQKGFDSRRIPTSISPRVTIQIRCLPLCVRDLEFPEGVVC